MHLLRRYGELLEGLGGHPGEKSLGLPTGHPAPWFTISDLNGEIVSLDELQALQRPASIVFIDPNCVHCKALLPVLQQLQTEHGNELTIVMVSGGERQAVVDQLAEYDLQRVVVQPERELFQAFQVQGTPTAVVVLPDGTIGNEAATGAAAVRQRLSDMVEAFDNEMMKSNVSFP